MKNNTIFNKIGSGLTKAGFKLQQHTPEILIAVGVTGTVISAVMACKATTKISTILDDAKDTFEKIDECLNDPKRADEYSKEDARKDLVITYVQTGVKLLKLYGPALVVGGASIAMIFASNDILRKRSAAIAAAYASLDAGFKAYRSRVAERYGDEVDRDIRFNVKSAKVEEIQIDENGKEKKAKKQIKVSADSPSDYARIFDKNSSKMFDSRDEEYNLFFLKKEQSMMNDRLRAYGFVFLNDVYERLGFPKTQAGQAVGWIYNPYGSHNGDNLIDFGLIKNETANEYAVIRNEENPEEFGILLDFNVDGVITNALDRI